MSARTTRSAALSDTWQDFKDGGEGKQSGGSRLSSVGTNRYDFWTVAWERFTDHPVRGIGSENFQQDYLQRGSSAEQPRYPHSLVLGVLSQTGLVGVAAGRSVAARGDGRRAGAEAPVRAGAAALGGVALVTFVYWLLHASVDWFWEFAGITGPAVAMLGLATATGRRPPPAPGRHSRRRPGTRRLPRAVPAAAAALAGAALAVSLALPWLSERQTRRALAELAGLPGRGIRPARTRIRSQSPGHAAPPGRRDDRVSRWTTSRRAREEFEKVLELEPRTPFALAELAALASERGNRIRAEKSAASCQKPRTSRRSD